MLQGVILRLRCTVQTMHFRSLSKLSAGLRGGPGDGMQAWQMHSCNGLESLELSNIGIPVIMSPTDVLVKIGAASVSPIDVSMTDGYGNTLLNAIRKTGTLTFRTFEEMDLPLTLGGDFGGVIVSKGLAVGDGLKLGEEVWGVVPIEQRGCHASCVVVNSNLVNPRPRKLSRVGAASILCAGLAAWSALWMAGGLCYGAALVAGLNGRVLVVGGSGGVGTLAVQLLKAWNMHVISACSGDAVGVLQSLGADVVVDCRRDGAGAEVISEGPYDMILDCANRGPEHVGVKGCPHDTYIALGSPLLKNVDHHGLIMGMARNLGDLLRFGIPDAEGKSCVGWAFFVPSQTGINVLRRLVEGGRQVCAFQDLPQACERLKRGRLGGKLVIDVR